MPSSTLPCISNVWTTAWIAPHVVGVALDRGEADALGPVVVAGLFEPEGVHALHEPGVRVVGIEARQRAADAVAQVLGVADEEVE